MNIFERLVQNNQFPILFIGSGISKRYLEDFPSWIQLLKLLWEELGEEMNFFSKYRLLQDEISTNYNLSGKELEFKTNILLANEIAEKFDKGFYEGKIPIKDYTSEYFFHNQSTSPFKEKIVEMLQSYNFIKEKESEIALFQKALLKSQVIFTTNYDSFIEDLYNDESSYEIKKYIGQSGFFKNSFGYAELFKIHGCVSNPESLVILEKDYADYNENSILISATIISLMINSPIIFLGYSLSDLNVRKYIGDFAKAANNEQYDLAEKLIVVEYSYNQKEFIEETIFDSELNCRFTYVKTDNYSKIYEYIRKIDQGVAPSEVRKYQHLIKQIILDSGEKGQLNSVLVSPVELELIEKMLNQNGIVESNFIVALGDSKYIFQIPNVLDYVKHYFGEEQMPLEIALRFLAAQPNNSRLPMSKYLTIENINNSSLLGAEKERLRQRLDNYSNIDYQIDSINSSYKKVYDDIDVILGLDGRKYTKDSMIAYNIKRLDIEKIRIYIKKEIQDLAEKNELKIETEFRRLMLIFDLLENKKE
ncbi:SIR2 family protein [Lysinibacillus fusiformis]|uniref:SIR2 family protein n=1 Tax=Lysinibacillus fusiformis TaxID=28031 RepID=UPI000D39B850|nr:MULTISPECIES: SIR2 family protein [Lysinibacillus]MED4668166.1 SIR2 family protein [Lysinibacillus fusiformis]QAS58564.1 hypothetical protein LSP_20695 [Lysinibacillus sphaericus]RDV35438.1 hypothetical protein C7B90_02420 [Lysinibacillus fusiformis]GED63912.1 hypothetical protein LFU01_23640 [Lysinibacillus fusiformis]